MTIAVDFREGARPTRAGKGEYVWQLVNQWVTGGNDDLLLLVERRQSITLPAGHWHAKSIPGTGLLWQLWVIAWLEFFRPVQLYFSATSLIVPALVRRVPTITTLADFTVWRFPQLHLRKAILIEKLFMPWALKFSSHLLAISEFTKQEAIDLFHISPPKITVTPLAAAAQFNAAPPLPEVLNRVRQRYALPNNFILYLGTLEPRKNVVRLIEAFAAIAPRFPDLHLVLAGGRGWQTDALLSQLPPQVVLTGYIDEADRVALYHLAQVFVFPSLYEGFGLPPLEAMACGTPVITSRTASLLEVVDDAALLIDPTDMNDLADALTRLLNSSALQQELRAKGLHRTQVFSWSRTLEHTLMVIHHYV